MTVLSSRRTCGKIIIARTIADLASDATIATHHLAEALQYRPKEVG